MSVYETAKDKAHAVARMYFLGGEEQQPLGPGSKEKRSAVEALGTAVGLDLRHVPGKVECCRQIAGALGIPWDTAYWSAGDTVTLQGLNALVDAAVNVAAPQDALARKYFMERLLEVGPVAVERTEQHEDVELAGDVEAIRIEFLDDESVPVTPVPEDTTPDAPELTAQQREILERVALLSQVAEAVPAGVVEATTPYRPLDGDFVTGKWRSALRSVQDWLHLAAELDTATETSLARSFFEGIGDATELSGVENGAWSSEFLTRLGERLDRAVALRDAFETEVLAADDLDGAVAAATVTWKRNWDDADDEAQSEVDQPIQALADTWPIADFVQHARDGELDLSPSYQRADVWPNSDAQILVESVLRGIPLPSVILLQRADSGVLRFEVVDGKQRLTSILRFTGNHPTALDIVEHKSTQWEMPDLMTIFQVDYPRFKKLWKQNEGENLSATKEREYYFPFPLRSGAIRALSGELEPFKGRYYSDLRNLPITVVGEPRTVRSLFEQTSQYRLPVIVYKQVTSEQIHEVFSLYNKQGKHLNAEEIRNALYHHLPLMKALLVAAGDTQDLDGVAPFLRPLRGSVTAMGRTLGGYGFARAGFRRTKLLAWVASALLVEEGRPDSRSTARHVDLLFKGVDESQRSPLRTTTAVTSLVEMLALGVEAHRAVAPSTWSPTFRNAQAYEKWQELQLVGVLIGFAAASAVRGEDVVRDVTAATDEWRELSSARGWARPEKTQSKVQWSYIAGIVADILETLDVPASEVAAALRTRFGSSGVDGLVRLAATQSPQERIALRDVDGARGAASTESTRS
ncbi:GmrSD restriction endonuclease domain-containing protein [Demequina flava]|uniref:GmrSD restriction endonuclease domain-containing protein n=1 Tax=Demequina flava TaxID=1095025 RepID=UPI000785CE7F|nr:DUF262 domain-containing protein [Demequina flava]